MSDGILLLCGRNYHIINQLYFNKTLKMKKSTHEIVLPEVDFFFFFLGLHLQHMEVPG